MEHRHHSRVPLGLEMLIYQRGMPVATGRIRDASRSGVFVETDYGELREHQSLEFEFRLVAGEPLPTRHRVAAHVLRRAFDGVALEVDDADRNASHVMVTLLASKAAAPLVRTGVGALAAAC